MCFSSLVLSRRPNIFKKRTKTLKNPLTPIGSCRDLHIFWATIAIFLMAISPFAGASTYWGSLPFFTLALAGPTNNRTLAVRMGPKSQWGVLPNGIFHPRAVDRELGGNIYGCFSFFDFWHVCAKTICLVRFLSIHLVQNVINNITQLSGRGIPCIFYMKWFLSQLYVFLVLQTGSRAV